MVEQKKQKPRGSQPGKGGIETLPTEAQALVLEVYRRHREELCRFAARSYAMLGGEVEDLIQSAFEKFATSPHLLAIENPRAFLYKLVNNLALNHFRHSHVQQRYAAETFAEAEEGELSYDANPENIAQNQQELAQISTRIMAMPDKRREIVMMHRFEHLSFAEIGRRLGITEAAVRKHIKKALHDIGQSQH